jgi:PKD repeat protein
MPIIRFVNLGGRFGIFRSLTNPANPGLPVAAFSGTPVSGTAPLTVVFTSTSTGSALSYFWDFGDGASSTSPNPSKTYNAAGTYTVALTVTNSAGSNTQTRTNYVTVNVSAPAANLRTPIATTQPNYTNGTSSTVVNPNRTTLGA